MADNIMLGDGSNEWTPEWQKKLNHKFEDDGDFWIAYEDLLRKFQAFDRTRLFGPEWQVAQIWTTFTVPWTLDYHDTHFSFSISKPGPVVIVLSQLDDRYFRGLEGQYHFELAFRLHKAGREDYLVRSQSPYRMKRSVNVELDLKEGEYQVLVKIAATRREHFEPVDRVLRDNVKKRRDKLIRVGLAYDLAHGKGQFIETLEEKASRERRQRKDDEKKRQQTKKKILSSREETHHLRVKKFHRDKKKLAKRRERCKKGGVDEDALLTFDEPRQDSVLDEGEDTDRQTKEAHLSESPGAIINRDGSLLPISERNGDNQEDALGFYTNEDLESLETLSDLTDRELNLHIDAMLNHSEDVAQKAKAEDSEEESDEFQRDPWNAVVVAGLRVYHKASEGDDSEDIVRLKVVRPSLLETDSEDEQKMNGLQRSNTGLDVDDSAKDATLEGGLKERKKSILGDALRAGQ